VKVFPYADHGLCKTRTGGPKEASERGKGQGPDFVPGYLDAMTGWLEARFGK
jgi:hypothetical protein